MQQPDIKENFVRILENYANVEKNRFFRDRYEEIIQIIPEEDGTETIRDLSEEFINSIDTHFLYILFIESDIRNSILPI